MQNAESFLVCKLSEQSVNSLALRIPIRFGACSCEFMGLIDVMIVNVFKFSSSNRCYVTAISCK